MSQSVTKAFGAGAVMSKLDKFNERMAALRGERDEMSRAVELIQNRIVEYDKMIEAFEGLRSVVSEETLINFLESKKSTQIDNFIEGNFSEHSLIKDLRTPLDYAMQAKQILEEVGRPLRRGQLVKEFEKRAFLLPGKDRNKNLGTILWRHPALIVSIPKMGYWSKGVPLPGVYDPDTFVAPSANHDSDESE